MVRIWDWSFCQRLLLFNYFLKVYFVFFVFRKLLISLTIFEFFLFIVILTYSFRLQLNSVSKVGSSFGHYIVDRFNLINIFLILFLSWHFIHIFSIFNHFLFWIFNDYAHLRFQLLNHFRSFLRFIFIHSCFFKSDLMRLSLRQIPKYL